MTIWQYLSNKKNGWKIFERDLFLITLSTTLNLIVYKLLLHLGVIFKRMTGPDNTHQEDLQA